MQGFTAKCFREIPVREIKEFTAREGADSVKIKKGKAWFLSGRTVQLTTPEGETLQEARGLTLKAAKIIAQIQDSAGYKLWVGDKVCIEKDGIRVAVFSI